MNRLLFACLATWTFGVVMLHGATTSAAMVPGAPAVVRLFRTPDGGVQPQVAVDAHGIVHLIYLTGDPAHSDVLYRRSTDQGQTWSAAVRVNAQPGAAMAIGTVRGAHLAVGREGRAFVAWMGSAQAEPRAPGRGTPMLVARSNPQGTAFEPQRNVIVAHPGLDGGGSIAADDQGRVFVAWHAPERPRGTEQDRRVWVARSEDDGVTFAPEVAISDPATGACGCCGMRLLLADGCVVALYRGAAQQVNRGMQLAQADGRLGEATTRELAAMKAGTCVMSTAAAWPAPRGGTAIAWETADDVFWSLLNLSGAAANLQVRSLPGANGRRKHPAIAIDAAGQTLVAWAEGTGWARGGSLGWQRFDRSGAPAGPAGRAEDLGVWDAPAVFPTDHRGFVIVY